MNPNCHQPTSEFLDLMYSNMLFPLIMRPTRITSNTATLIDNIFTNNLNHVTFNGLLFTDISDHLPVFSISRDQYNEPDITTPIVYRDKSESNVLKFQNELGNSCFPLKKQTVKRGTLNKSWLSKVLLESIRKKNKLYKRYLRNPSPQNEKKYKK